MANHLGRIDWCKGVRIAKNYDPQPPLDTVDPLGIASLGCQPVFSHRILPDGTILSRIKEKNGAYVASLLKVGSDQDPASYPAFSAAVAAFRGAVPITGAVASPYPATGISYVIDFQIDGNVFQRESQPHVPQPQFGAFPIGFGRESQSHPQIILGNGETYDMVGQGIRRAYHDYQEEFLMPYAPSDPMTIYFDHVNSEYTWHASGFGTSFSLSFELPIAPATPTDGYNANVTMWECHACLQSAKPVTIDPQFLDNQEDQLQPPGMVRAYTYYDFDQVTMPAWGGTYGATYNMTGMRPWLVIYANDQIESISLNGIPGANYGGSSPSARLPYFAPPFNFFTGTQSFSWALSPFTTDFQFDVTVAGQVISIPAKTVGDALVPRYYEAFAVGSHVIL